MRTFSKSNKLDNVLYDVRGPVVDEANRMEEMGKALRNACVLDSAQQICDVLENLAG